MHTKISTIDGRRKNFTLPAELTNRISQLAKESNMKLTQLIKIALEEFLAKKEKEQLEKQIIEWCKTYYDQDKETAEAWVVAEAKFEIDK